MDRQEQSTVLPFSGIGRTEKPLQQIVPTKSDIVYEQNSHLEQLTGRTERSCSYSSIREEFGSSKGRHTAHAPIATMSLKRRRIRGVSEENEYCSSDSEVSSETEPPVKTASDSATSIDSDDSNDSSSSDSSSSSSSSGDSTTTSTSSNDDLNSNASTNIQSQGVAAALPRNKRLATKGLAFKESTRSFIEQNTSSASVDDADPSHVSMSPSSCNVEDKEEDGEEAEEEKQTMEEEIPPLRGYYFSSRPVPQQSRSSVCKPCLETGAADSSTDSATNTRIHSALGARSISMGEESVSHIPLPSSTDGGLSLEPAEEPHPRNLVRIVMKKSEVTRGISAKKLTKNPVINIFGEIVFDGCTFEGETRAAAAERAADVLTPPELGQRELGQRELELSSEEIRNRVCDDILQKEIKREIGEGRGRSRAKEKEEQEEMERQGIFDGYKVEDERGRSLQTVGKPKESRNNCVIDISNNLEVAPSETLTERFPTRLVDYDDDDVGSCQGRSKSEDENMSDTSALRIALRKDLQGARGSQRNMKHRSESHRSYSRKRRHSPSTSPSTDERDSVDGSEPPHESKSDVKHRAEMTRHCNDGYSYATGLKVLKNSDKRISDLRCSDLQRHTRETRAQKWDEFDRSESQTTRRKLERTCNTATALKIRGRRQSTDRAISSEVERNRKVKALATATRSKSGDYGNLDIEEIDPSEEEEEEEELKRRDSRRPRDSPQSKVSDRRMSLSQRSRSSARTSPPNYHRFGSRHKRGSRHITPTRATTPDRNPKSRRSETGYGEAGVRRKERRRSRSIDEGPGDIANAQQGRLEETRRRSRTSSDRPAGEQILDKTRNVAVSKSARTAGSRSTTSRSEQSGKTRSRSSTVCDDASNRQSIRRRSSTSTSFKSYPEETCLQVEHDKRERTRQTEAPSSSEHRHRCDESETTRQSGSVRGSRSEGVKRAGEVQARPRSSRDGTDASDHTSDGYHHPTANHYPKDWTWSTRAPGRLKESPNPYPFPYLHPFAQPFASPMLRYNSYVYANYCNEDPRRYFLAQQPPSFYPQYHHRPHLPYWAPPLHQNLYPTYAPYETAVGQDEGAQYEGDEGCHHNDLPLQDELQNRTNETDEDFRSLALKVDQKSLMEEESAAIHTSTASLSIGGDTLGAAATTRKTTAEEAIFTSSAAV